MKSVANVVLNSFTNDSRVLKTSLSLSKIGMSVTVVALGNNNLPSHEMINEVVVDRINPIARSLPKIKLFQLLTYFEFLVTAALRYRKVDVVHCNDLNALPVGIVIKLLNHKTKVVYDCHEYETELHGLGRIEKLFRKALEWATIRFADSVLTVSESIAAEYARIYKAIKPHVLLNCPNFGEPEKNNIFRERFGIRNDQVIFLYQGGLSKGRGIETIVDAFMGLKDDQIVLVFMGYGPLENLIRAASLECKLIYFHSAVPPSVLLNYTSSADYGILFYEDTCLNHRYCFPNKIFEYIMAGLPVLVSDLSEMRRLVLSEEVGVVAIENTVTGFRFAIESTLKLDYKSMLSKVISIRPKYSWQAQELVLEKVYNDL